MKGIVISLCFVLSAFQFAIADRLSRDTLFTKSGVDLVLRNPILLGNFFVSGTLSLLDDRISFKVNNDLEFRRSSRTYRYNNLVKDLDIPYHQVKKIRRGVFKLVIASKLVVILHSGKTYRFDTLTEKKKIIRIVRGKLI